MKLFYDKEKSLELMQRIVDKFEEEKKKTTRGSEMHVYDLIYCQVKAYCRLLGIEKQVSKANLGLMVFGIVTENVIGYTYPQEDLQFKTNISLVDPNDNIYGHIDIYENGIHPLEVKGSRKSIFKSGDVPKSWVEQLMSYMAMQGATIGWIVIFNVFSAQIMAFRLVMTNDDLLDWLVVLTTRAGRIKIAVGDRNPSALEIHPLEYASCDYKKTCPRQQECRRMSIELKRSDKKSE